MPREFVNPNLHVALIHFPLGLLIAGTLIELFSFMWRRHGFRAAGRWMILLGALTGIPVATSGIYALADVSRAGLTQEQAAGTWSEVAAISPAWKDHDQAHMLRDHVVLQSWAIGLAVLVCVTWIGSSDAWRTRLHLPLLALLLISTGLTIAGAWHGGEAVYRFGTGVQIEPATQPSIADDVVAEQAGVAPQVQREAARGWQYFFPPMQIHVIMAGLTVALALAALALSFRAANAGPPRTDADNIAAALGPPPAETSTASIIAELEERRRRRPPEPQDVGPRIPSARFWLLTFVVGLLTALGGALVLWVETGATRIDPRQLWSLVQYGEDASPAWLTRRMAHVGGGVSIVVLSLVLALFARVAPRARIILLLLGLLLLAAVAAQIWFGVLLMYDTVNGPVIRFN